MLRQLVITALLLGVAAAAGEFDNDREELYAKAVGKLTHEIMIPSGAFMASSPPVVENGNISCRAMRNGEDLPLENAYFTRESDGAVFPIKNLEKLKAELFIGSNPLTDASKYRCAIKAQKHDELTGDLFIYVRPFFYSKGELDLRPSSSDPFYVYGGYVSSTEGYDAELTCPVRGYPFPTVSWTKDGQDVVPSDHITFHKDGQLLQIKNLTQGDDGTYVCAAANIISKRENGEMVNETFTSHLSQRLHVACHPDSICAMLWWIIPLGLLLVLILLLLVLFCVYKIVDRAYRTDYNVSKLENKYKKDGRPSYESHNDSSAMLENDTSMA